MLRYGKAQRFRVVGVTFRPRYPHNVHQLSQLLQDAQITLIRERIPGDAGIPTVLRRDPANSADPNAIEVHVPSMGRAGWIGFVAKDLAARWAPAMDNGAAYEARVVDVPIMPSNPGNPGVDVEVVWHTDACARRDQASRSQGLHCTCNDNPPDWTI